MQTRPVPRGDPEYAAKTDADMLEACLRDVPPWYGRLDRVMVFGGTIEDFIRQLVHSDEECPLNVPGEVFKAVPLDGAEEDMHAPLVEGLRELVAEFPPEKRMQFAELDPDEHTIDFPYEQRGCEVLATCPDIVASLPGRNEITLPPKWRDLSLAFNVDPALDFDFILNSPFGSPYTYVEQSYFYDLANSALNMLVAHLRLFVFVINVFGPEAHIFRFDRDKVFISPRFNYIQNPGILQNFMWRFVHPEQGAGEVVGADPTVQWPSHDDLRWARKRLKKANLLPMTEADKEVCRWLTMKGPEPDSPETTMLGVRLLFIKPRLFSRTTMMWEGLRKDSDSGGTVVFTDSWNRPSDLEIVTDADEHAQGLFTELSESVTVGENPGQEVDAARSEPDQELAKAGQDDPETNHTDTSA